jgi:hypothetical protein
VAGSATLAGCSFTVPQSKGEGPNDVVIGGGGKLTFACPPGTTGTPVTMTPKAGTYTDLLPSDLPPSKEIVHCR